VKGGGERAFLQRTARYVALAEYERTAAAAIRKILHRHGKLMFWNWDRGREKKCWCS